jgi:hypothetical protein
LFAKGAFARTDDPAADVNTTNWSIYHDDIQKHKIVLALKIAPTKPTIFTSAHDS